MSRLRERQPVASRKAQAAEAHFNRWAGAYGRSRLLPSLQRKALAQLQPGAGDRLLDVACGAGALVVEIAPRVERAVGVDLSEGMLELARSRLRAAEEDHPLGDVEFVQRPSDRLLSLTGASRRSCARRRCTTFLTRSARSTRSLASSSPAAEW